MRNMEELHWAVANDGWMETAISWKIKLRFDFLVGYPYFYIFVHELRMRKGLAYFFLTCSLVLVIGHSMFPHNHDRFYTENYQLTESTNLSLADIIKISLSHNLGLNHLEEYRSYDALNFSEIVHLPEIIVETRTEIGVAYFLNTLCCPTDSAPLRSRLEPLVTTERGPPLLS